MSNEGENNECVSEIKSTTNPDICGRWNASDVEAEMIDLEIPLKNDTSWIEYIIS